MRLAFLTIALFVSTSLPANESPHGALSCDGCHQNATESEVALPLPVVRCQSCHEEGIGLELRPSHSHPVGIEYRFRPGTSLRDPGTAASGLGGTVEEDMLDDGRIVCTSCHDPHGEADAMLVLEPGQLCTACHDM